MKPKTIYKFILLSIFLVLSSCNFAYAQSATSISRTCAGVNPTVKKATVTINKDGSITLVACAGKTVTLNGTTYTGSGAINFVDKETPTGAINDTNTVYTLAFTPIAGSEYVYLNGQLQTVSTDYSITNSTITFVVAPPTGSIIRVSYRK